MIRIHREGRLILALTLLVLLVIQVLSALYLPAPFTTLVAMGSLALLILVLRFFRVPRRRPFMDDRSIVAPADGKVVVVEHTSEKEFLHSKCIQVSIFMSIHDVHINYFPVDGKVVHHQYHPGSYLVARHPKSSELNESFSTGIETPFGSILVRQIAGYVARRIRNYTAMNRSARQGREMGFIKFGSRLDLFLPADARILVKVGERVAGGVTPVARFKIKDN
jgi:phosphatidylserine decarboxylase